MPNPKFQSLVLKSQLMEILKFQYSNVLVLQSQQPASHVLRRHVLIAVRVQQQAAQNVSHLNVHHLIVPALNVLLQIAREPSVQFLVVHVQMHHVARNQHLKRLLMTSAKSQRHAQLNLYQSAQRVLIAIQHQLVIRTLFHQLVAMPLKLAQLEATMVVQTLNHASVKNMFQELASAAKTQLAI
jgi:hypothetical protein